MQEVSGAEVNDENLMVTDDSFSQVRIMTNGNCEKDTLVFHVHGGGFVSMSSGSHQNYTRVWA